MATDPAEPQRDSPQLTENIAPAPELGVEIATEQDAEWFSEPEAETAQELAVAAWESAVDDVLEHPEVPVEEQSRRLKEAFDRLAPEDRLDGIQQAVNLLPDEQFPALFEILYDPAEDSDVLDAIFSDALNRPDEIKQPLLEALRQNRVHPMFFESARIWDMVAPEEEP